MRCEQLPVETMHFIIRTGMVGFHGAGKISQKSQRNLPGALRQARARRISSEIGAPGAAIRIQGIFLVVNL